MAKFEKLSKASQGPELKEGRIKTGLGFASSQLSKPKAVLMTPVKIRLPHHQVQFDAIDSTLATKRE